MSRNSPGGARAAREARVYVTRVTCPACPAEVYEWDGRAPTQYTCRTCGETMRVTVARRERSETDDIQPE